MPLDGARPVLVWHVVHATRPALSLASKMSRWMLANVGSRFGDGPAMLDSFSSHPATAMAAHPTTTIIHRFVINPPFRLLGAAWQSAFRAHGRTQTNRLDQQRRTSYFS